MKLNSLQSLYIQKSRIFLYPWLGIKRGVSVTPIETYLSWKDNYSVDECKLICNYHIREDLDFKHFEEKMILGNRYFSEFYELGDGTGAYIFDFLDAKNDYLKVVNGKYSQLSEDHKNMISDFFRSHNTHHIRILSYLEPSRFISDYATLWGVKQELLEKVGELCDLPDLEKENFQVLKKSTTFELINSTNINKL